MRGQNHSSQEDDTRDATVHTRRPQGQGVLLAKGKEHCLLAISKMPWDGENPANAEEGTLKEVRDAQQQCKDQSWERQAAMDLVITDALARNTMVKFTALLNEHVAASMPTALKTSSGATGISAMPPFYWTRDQAIYQQWQAWSKKAKHAMKAMDGDSDGAKISYFHHWIDTEGMAQVETWMNNGVLLKQEDFDKLESEEEKKGKYSQDNLKSYFTLFALLLATKSNPLLAAEELYNLKQNSMTTGEFHAQITKTAKRCNFPNKEAEERATRYVLYRGMNSSHVRDKCINVMNNDNGELTINFLMQHLEKEDSNSHQKHQQEQKCAATNQRCKACSKMGPFARVCMTSRRQQGGNKMVANIHLNERERHTCEDELGYTQPCPPKVIMIKVINQPQTH